MDYFEEIKKVFCLWEGAGQSESRYPIPRISLESRMSTSHISGVFILFYFIF